MLGILPGLGIWELRTQLLALGNAQVMGETDKQEIPPTETIIGIKQSECPSLTTQSVVLAPAGPAASLELVRNAES